MTGFPLRALTPKPAQEHRLWVAHFGGLFNPIHDGHLAIGRQLIDRYLFDRVIYVPGSSHYPKADLAPEGHRLDLLKLSIRTEPRFEACDYELGKEDWTEPFETLQRIADRFTRSPHGARLFSVRGDDWLPQMLTWTELADHENLYEFIIVPRILPDVSQIAVTASHAAVVERMTHELRLPAPFTVSASDVRARLGARQTSGLPVPAGVLEEIERRALYQSDDGGDHS